MKSHFVIFLVILFGFFNSIYAQNTCATAVNIPVEMYSTCGLMALQNVDLNSATASTEAPNPTCGNFSTSTKDLWYKFTVPAGVNTMSFHAFNSNLTTPLFNNSEPAMAIYRGNDCSTLTLLACFASNGGFGTNGEIRWQPVSGLIPGETIWIRTWDKDNVTGQKYFIAASVRLNMEEDDCNTPMPLGSSGCNILSTGGDIPAPDQCGWGTTDNSIFFYFTVNPGDPQPYTISAQNGQCWNNGGGENPEIQFAVYSWNGVNCTGIGGTGATYQGCANGTGTVIFSANLAPGNYILAMDGYSTLSGNSLCLFGFEAPYIEEGDIQINLNTTNAICGIGGSASVTVLQSCTGFPTIQWSTGATGFTINNLQPGDYSVTVSDGPNCESVVQNFTITSSGNISANITTTGSQCDPTISATANVTGANPAQCTYEWNTTPPQNSQTAIISSSGTYTVTVTYGTCTTTAETTINFHPHILVYNFSDHNCINGNLDYEVSFSVNSTLGGPAQFYVNNGTSNTLYNGSFSATYPSGTGYTLTITDVNECDIFAYNGLTDCGCATYAGTMASLEPIILCANECTNMVSHNEDQFVQSGEMLEFIVHTGEYAPTSPLARGSSPNFCFSQLMNGQYGVTYYISAIAGQDLGGYVNIGGPCYSQSPGTPVVWFENPIAFIPANELTTCGLEITLNATPPQQGITGVWSSNGQFVTTNGTNVYSPQMSVLAANYGDQIFTWSVNNGICSAQDQVLVHFLPKPTAYAGEDFSICGIEAELNAIISIDGSNGQWTGPGNFANQFSPNTTVTSGNFGPQTFTWRENYGICWSEDQITVTFIQGPNPIITNSFDTVCGITANLSVTGVTGSGYWTAYFNGNPLSPAPSYSNGSNSPNTSVTIPAFEQGELSRTIQFVWTETTQNAGVVCEASATANITFARKPTASVGSVNEAEVCGNQFTFNADITGSEWAESFWISPLLIANFDNQSSPTATVTINTPGSYGDSAWVRAPFVWAMRNTGCTSVDTMWVSFYRRPVANAGLDGSICGNNYTLGAVYSLPQTQNYQPFGIWSVGQAPVAGAAANINPQTGDTVSVTVSHYGQWRFVFRENNSNLSSCFSTDTVVITFHEIPVISAGPDKHVCGQSTNLEGISAGFAGQWVPNGVYIQDYNSPTTQVTTNTYGPINFVWIESNQYCSAIDTVIITFWRIPNANILTDPADSTVCGLTFTRLRAELPSTGTRGYWYALNPAAYFDDPWANFTSVTVPSYGNHYFYWVVENGPEDMPGFCADTAGPLRIRFIQIPTANAGNDTLFCGNSGYLSAIPSVGSGVWSTPSTNLITIENPNDPYSYIESQVLNAGNPANPYFLLIWTEDNTNGCTDKDTIKVSFARIPSSDVIIIPPKCFGEEATIRAVEDTLQQYTWNFFNGQIVQSFTNSQGGNHRNFVRWNDGTDFHVFNLITTNYWGCNSPIAIDTVYEPPIPEFDVTIIKDTCALGKGGLIFNENTPTTAFFWIYDTVGPAPGPITQVLNIPAGDYGIRTSYLTPNTQYISHYLSTFGTQYCIDTFYYTIQTVGMIDAQMEIAASIDLENLVAPNAVVTFLNNSIYDDVRKRCEWNFGDGTKLKNCDPMVEHTYTKFGCYEPFLIVMNRDLPECRDTARLSACIQVDDESMIEVPNIFSPNGDGINDFFQVKARTLKTFTGQIVNRYGKVVYTWENWQDYEAGWDGNLEGGSKAVPGVYYYIIKASGWDDKEYNLQGVLHLMRD
jgi:gliding motility-associated-like protein